MDLFQAENTSEFSSSPRNQQKHVLQQQLGSAKQYEDLLKQYQELEVKSKTDMKVLVKEIRSLRKSQSELKQHLNQSHEEKLRAEVQLGFSI